MSGRSSRSGVVVACHLALAGVILLAVLTSLSRGGRAGGGPMPAGVFGLNVRVDDTGSLMDARGLGPKAFVAEDGTVYVVWADGRAAPGSQNQDDLYFAKSTDGGLSYGPNVPVAVTTNRSGGGSDIVVARDGTIFVIWGEQIVITGVSHTFFSFSTDGGTTFSSPLIIDGHGWDESCLCGGDDLASYGDTLYAGWIQRAPDPRGSGFFLARSIDRGGTWTAPDRIDDAGSNDIQYPGLAVDDAGRVYAVWADRTSGEIRVARSVDSGLTFGPSVAVSPPGWIAVTAAIGAGGSQDAYVAWTNTKSDEGGYANRTGTVFLTRVTNGGTTALAPVKVTDLSFNATHVRDPAVAVDGSGFVYVVWPDDRGDTWGDIYLARSLDNGGTFEGNERVVDVPLNDGTVQAYPDIATNANGSVVIVWQDGRRDTSSCCGGDIYSAVPTYVPDLSVGGSDISWSPAMPTESTPVVVNATVRNIGWDISPSTVARFHDGLPPAPQIGIDQAVTSLSVNGTTTVSVTWTAASPGTYDLCIVVDPDGAIPEGDETNNLACRRIVVISSLLPDLTLGPADIRVSPPSPVTDGTTVRLDADVRNVGDASSPAAFVRVYDGIPPSPQVGSDQPLPPLSPGAFATLSILWAATPPGSHNLCVVVDPDGSVFEGSETNNSACVTVEVLPLETRPDYAPVSPEPGAEVRVGLSMSVLFSVRVTNQGNATAAWTSVLSFFNASTPGAPFATFAVPPLAPFETSPRFTAAWTSPATSGTHHVHASVDSEHGLLEWDEGNNEIVWTVEVLAGPVTNLIVGVPNVTASEVYVTSATPLSFTILDQGGSGIRDTTYRVDGGSWINYTAAGPFALAGDGGHRVEWFSEDNAGNVEPVASQFLLLDDTPPVTALVLGNPKHLGVETFVTSLTPVSLTASDGGATPVGIAALEYRVDGGSWTSYAGSVYLTGEGTHAFDFRASDRLGNVESFLSATVVVDDTAPAISIDIGTPQYVGAVTYVTSVTYFALSAVEGGTIPVGLGTVEYLEGGSWNAYSAPFALGGTDGARTIAYRAADLLGNEFADQIDIVLDNAAPVTAPSHGEGTYPSGTVFAFTATDSGAGVASTEYSIDGIALRPYTAPLVIPEGTHVLRYRSTDLVNNREAERTLVVTIEGAPPPVAEWNWKPLVAAVFSAILVIVGMWSSSKAPSRVGARPRLRAFAFTALPFVLGEGTTGVVSLLTGFLAIPPLLGAGTALDLGILLVGISLCVYRVRSSMPPL